MTKSEIINDSAWLAHRIDTNGDLIHFLNVDRDEHRRVTFLTDEYLTENLAKEIIPRRDCDKQDMAVAPVHFIYHSAFCCSTLLARAFDLDGQAMGLKEPVILNDLAGWIRRGAGKVHFDDALESSLRLLSRPFDGNGPVIVKPSNVTNNLIAPTLTTRPHANALFLHAPLRTFITSIAKKGMWGRLWVRDLFGKTRGDKMADFGYSEEDIFGQTDLQIAALCWLGHQAHFAQLIEQFGADRIKTLDSETLLANKADVVAALASHFGIELDGKEVQAIVTGPAFSQNSKSMESYSDEARTDEYESAEDAHGEEIDMVVKWAEVLADHLGLKMTLPSPLLG